MSRIGKKIIPIPDKVKVTVTGSELEVKGPKGTLKRAFSPLCSFAIEGSELRVERQSEEPKVRALHGLTRAIAANMVKGVSDGFNRVLDIVGVGYRAEVKGNQLVLSLGYSHPINFDLPAGIQAKVEEKNTRIILDGFDRELLGLVAAKIRGFRPPEPYKGKGVKYSDEKIVRKAGKSGSK